MVLPRAQCLSQCGPDLPADPRVRQAGTLSLGCTSITCEAHENTARWLSVFRCCLGVSGAQPIFEVSAWAGLASISHVDWAAPVPTEGS